jgi:predicted nucleotidyltransferase
MIMQDGTQHDTDGFHTTVKEAVRRIVETVQPQQVILFGSVARGDSAPDSDIDLLVVKHCKQRREVAGRIYRALIGVGRAVDVVVVTPEDVERYRQSRSMVIAPALQEGRVVYAI